MAEDDAPKTGRERVRELESGARHNAAEHELGTVYGLFAVAEAVLDLADAVRATTPPRKGPVLPLPRQRATGITPCKTCGHVRDMHHDEAACRAASCPCSDYVAVVPGG